MHEKDENIETYRGKDMWRVRQQKNRLDKVSHALRYSNGGVGVACGAAVTDGGSSS